MIFYFIVLVAFGVALAAFMPIYTPWFLLPSLAVLIFFKKYKFIILYVITIMIGCGYYHYRYQVLTHWHLPISHIKKPMLLEGQVVDLPTVTKHAVQFLFQLNNQSVLLQIRWYKPYPQINVGDQWRLLLSLKPPLGLHNPGGFDYQQWLIWHGIRATGYVKKSDKNHLTKRQHHMTINQWRQQLQQLIISVIDRPEVAGLLVALTTGFHGDILPQQWLVFQRTGTNHLMAISGLHIGMVAGFAFLLMGFIWRRFERLLLWQPVQFAQAVAAIVAAIVYGLMAGLSLPTQRAVLMILVVMLALLSRRQVPLWQRFVFAFCVVVIIDPFALHSSSLWMSFGSVFWIMYVCCGRWKSYSKWMQWGRLQLALLLGLAPLTLYYFHQVALSGFLANAFAVPWVGFVIVPLCLIAAGISLFNIPAAQLLFVLAGKCMLPLWLYLQWLSQQPWAMWGHTIAADWVLGAALLGVSVLLLPRGVPGRWFGLFLCIPLITYKPQRPLLDQLWLTVLDVGQGLATVIRTSQYTLVYDTGPKSYGGFDAGASVVVPFLNFYGIHKLDRLIVSHGDNDHIGGAKSILASIPTHDILTSVPRRFHQHANHCERGQQWQWGSAQFDVLWPLPGSHYQDNNSSCVVRVSVSDKHILLTGDIEKPVEDWLVAHDRVSLQADILVVPHHGSKTSSTEAFVDAVMPKIVVFSTGAYNQFHFPSPKVVARYRRINAYLYNTAQDGAIKVQLEAGQPIKLKTARS